MRVSLPLRITVPLTLFLVGLGLSILSIVVEVRVTNIALEELVRRHVHFVGNNVSGVASYFLTRGDVAGLKQQVAQLGSDIGMVTAVVCDEDGKILSSSRFDYIGQMLSQTHLDYVLGLFKELRAGSLITAQGERMIGVFPFLLPPAPGELLATKEGIVMLEFDLALPKSRLQKGLRERATMVVSVLAVVCGLLWFVFHKSLGSRISQIVFGTRKIAAGDLSARIPVKGADEVGQLGKAFNEMAARVQVNTEQLRDANSKLQQELGAREAAQAALLASETRFRSVWENSRDAMRLTDGSGQVVAANPAYLQLAGLPAPEVLGRCFLNHYQIEKPQLELEAYRKRFASRQLESRDYHELQFASGRNVHLEISSSFIESECEPPLLLEIFRDVTERVSSHEELNRAKEFSENLIRSANVLILGLTEQGKVQVFNDTAEKVLGWKKEEVIGVDWFERFIPPAERERLARVFAEVKCGRSRKCEHPVRTRNGDERIISWQNNEIVEDSQVTGTLSFGIDITEQRREEAKNRELERKLLEGQKLESLGILAGGIAHDFNNLLTSILGNAHLASMELEENSPIKPMLATIEKTSMRAADLCKQMLAYAGKSRMTLSSIDLNALVVETTELLQASISKKAQLVFNLHQDLPPVEGDESQVQQVLMNLVMNASEALGEEAGTVRISTGVVEASPAIFANARVVPDKLPEGPCVFLEVADTGCGMSPETQKKMFDPFFSTKFTGRGLGLAAVLGIVRSHNGVLRLDSTAGSGSTFRIIFPAGKPTAEPAKPSVADRNWRGRGTILVVDDDAQVRDLTSRILRGCGFEVLSAGDGAEGIKVFRENLDRIDMVLMDMTMPRLNGSEAFARMRSIRPNTKGLLMSGYSEPLQQQSIEQAGWSGFVQKPFKPDELGAKVRIVLGI